MKNKKWIPVLLTTLRLLLGPVALYCAVAGLPRIWFLPLLTAGLLSDIFDGVLARRFGVSTPTLRRYDSLTDIAYYLCILTSVGLLAPTLVVQNRIWIAAMLLSEAVLAAFGLIKFQRLAAAHSYLAKFFGLALFVGLAAILGLKFTTGVLPALAIIGVVVNAEIILMLFLTRKPLVDVPSVFHLRASI